MWNPEIWALVFTTVPWCTLATDGSRPRGVGPEFGKYYKSPDTFACISSPSIKIPSARVNDDYCDCPDGSDEPGTSACSYLSDLSPDLPSGHIIEKVNTSLALPGYYCKNKGHQPSYAPFLSVNDGVCDYEYCCDGSDEWAKVGGVSCPDKCKDIGKEWRKQEEVRQKALGGAKKKRTELAKEASRLRLEVEDQVKNLQIQIQGAELKVKDLEATLQEVERQERGRVVKPAGKGSPMGVLAGLAKDRVEELRGALVETRSHKDAYRDRIMELEDILAKFKEEYNPNFNDEGVKRAVRSWEEYSARDTPDFEDAELRKDLDEVCKVDDEDNGINWKDFEDQGEGELDLIYKIEAYLPPTIRIWLDAKLHSLRLLLIENGVLAAAATPAGSESKTVTDARNALTAGNAALADATTKLGQHRDDLAANYGADDIFRALKGRCVEKDSGEYTYELCWLERTTQKSKKGAGNTGMGNFVGLEAVEVDASGLTGEIGISGKAGGERVALRYENGQHCWNGPARSTLVVLGCAESDEIWRVVEEEKCVYRMEVGTAAVCGNGGSKAEGVKEEL